MGGQPVRRAELGGPEGQPEPARGDAVPVFRRHARDRGAACRPIRRRADWRREPTTVCRPSLPPCRRPRRPTCKARCGWTTHSGTTTSPSCASGSTPGWRTDTAPARHGEQGSQLTVRAEADASRLAFAGRLDAGGAGVVWRPAVRRRGARAGSRSYSISAASPPATWRAPRFLAAAESAHDGAAAIEGADARVLSLLAHARDGQIRPKPEAAPHDRPGSWRDLLLGFRAAGRRRAFLGEIALAVARAALAAADVQCGRICCATPTRRGCAPCRWLPVLGFLMGLILAFQSAVPMRQFGADLLCRQPGLGQPAARTWAAAGGGHPGRAHRVGLRRRDRHHEGERGDRRAGHDGPRSDDDAGAAAADRGDAGDAGHDAGAGRRRPARHGGGDAGLRLSAGRSSKCRCRPGPPRAT